MWTTPPGTVENQPTMSPNPRIQAENHEAKPESDNPLRHNHHDAMTTADALQLLARWVTELRAENAGLRRENEWHIQTLGRRWERIRHLERRVAQLDNRLYRFWMDTYTTEQTRELAGELVA